MRKIFLAAFCLPVPLSFINAQEQLNALSSPTSPASAVLGIQPSDVLSPKSYQALETAIYSSFTNNNGKAVIPNDFALEFTPYWTKNHSLTIEDYLYPKKPIDQVARNSSFSLASTQNFLLGDSTATNGIAFGYRSTFYLFNNKDREKIKIYREKLDKETNIKSTIVTEAAALLVNAHIKTKREFLDTMRPIVVNAIRKVMGDGNKTDEMIKTIYKESDALPALDPANTDSILYPFIALIHGNLKKDSVFNKFEDYIRNRQGLYVDLAYGTMLNFPTNDFEFSFVPRQAFWVTPTYRFKEKLSILKIMGVFRYEWHSTDYYKKYFPTSKFYQDNTDVGLAISGEFKKFSIQFEGVSRVSQSETPVGTDANGNQLYTKEKSSDIQYMGTFSYRLNDQFVLTYTLGKQFDPVLNPDNTLISKFSLNFGFGGPDKENVK